MFQKCPVCCGFGMVYSPVCQVCNGAGIIDSVTGLPPIRLDVDQEKLDYWLKQAKFELPEEEE